MIKILLPSKIINRLHDSLKIAGDKEIGGILMGEHVAENTFRVVEITIQHQTGTFTSFIRVLKGLASTLQSFFRRTNFEYKRYNYLGEWHSHPAFSLNPSITDVNTMFRIVGDKSVGANFVMLLLVKQSGINFDAASYIFFPEGSYEPIETVLENDIYDKEKF